MREAIQSAITWLTGLEEWTRTYGPTTPSVSDIRAELRAALERDEWTAVSDGLPPHGPIFGIVVVVMVSDGACGIGWVMPDGGWVGMWDHPASTVTHWHPFPDPPRI